MCALAESTREAYPLVLLSDDILNGLGIELLRLRRILALSWLVALAVKLWRGLCCGLGFLGRHLVSGSLLSLSWCEQLVFDVMR